MSKVITAYAIVDAKGRLIVTTFGAIEIYEHRKEAEDHLHQDDDGERVVQVTIQEKRK